MTEDFDVILEWIEKNYTPFKLVKVLGLDVSDLIVSLEDHIHENIGYFEDEMRGLL